MDMASLNDAVRYAFQAGYRVLPDGSVQSPKGKLRKLNPDSKCRLRFRINNQYMVLVHRLSAYQKFGEAMFADGIEVRHMDNNYLNNKETNLELGTHLDNMMDIPKHVRQRTASTAASYLKKLTDAQHQQLLLDREAGASYKQLMEKYGIAKATVSYIVNGKTYKDLYAEVA